MTVRVIGQKSWVGGRDDEGYRDYKLKTRVEHDARDGPYTILSAPGLPRPGSSWNFGNDNDVWAICRPSASVLTAPEYKEGDAVEQSDVEQIFSTRPLPRCPTIPVDNPLLEPIKLSGSFVKYTEEATYDRFGRPIVTSSWEQIRGAQVEFDANRPTVKVEYNTGILNIGLLARTCDCVNDRPMWGLPPRTIKLSTISWVKTFNGKCKPYFTITLEFDIRYETFDRTLLDEGSKVLCGYWDAATGRWTLMRARTSEPLGIFNPDRTNPAHFIRFKDRNGENTRVILNGFGEPYDPGPPAVEPAPVMLVGGGPCNAAMTAAINTPYGVYTVALVDPPFGSKFGVADSVNWWKTSAAGEPRKFVLTMQSMAAGGTGFIHVDVHDDACVFLTRYSFSNPGVGSVLSGLMLTATPFVRFRIWTQNLTQPHSFNWKIEGPVLPSSPGRIFVSKYHEANFFLLRVPASLT